MACNSLLNALTPQDFKDQFTRGFNFLPVWSAASSYNQNEVVYYETTRLFYICLNNGVTSVPTTTSDWQVTQGSIYDYVNDSDITSAYAEACASFNPDLWTDNDEMTLGYLYLAAHFLVGDFNANGVDSVAVYPVNSRSVGNISESFTIPDFILKHPTYSFLATTYYGKKYLNMVAPRLIGNVVSVWGGTNA